MCYVISKSVSENATNRVSYVLVFRQLYIWHVHSQAQRHTDTHSNALLELTSNCFFTAFYSATGQLYNIIDKSMNTFLFQSHKPKKYVKCHNVRFTMLSKV